jgi:hypothetical protein
VYFKIMIKLASNYARYSQTLPRIKWDCAVFLQLAYISPFRFHVSCCHTGRDIRKYVPVNLFIYL